MDPRAAGYGVKATHAPETRPRNIGVRTCARGKIRLEARHLVGQRR